MKYIRLKNGKIVSQFETVRTSEIVKKTDTIEELCDEFVEVGNYQPTLAEIRFEHWDKTTKNILNKQRKKVYGAIWTDKGLIYVAQMNEKGELELL